MRPDAHLGWWPHAAGLPTVGIIMLSQVIGGLLLPTISFCLLLVMNSKWLLRLKMAKE
eukprot:COSAG01_NODE_66099_length_271_cov_0.604651_1_plen_57_part_10